MREVQSISSDVEALIWAIGCLWAIRVERFIGKSRPGLNCTLLLTGLLFGANSPLTYSVWDGAKASSGLFPEAPYGLLFVFVFAFVAALIAAVTPGRPARRAFCAVIFPFLALLGLLAATLGSEVVGALSPPEDIAAVHILFLGPLFGVVVAAVLSLPCVLLYREIAAQAAALALTPVFAKTLATGSLICRVQPCGSPFYLIWPWLCSLMIIGISTHTCLTWVSRVPGEQASRAA